MVRTGDQEAALAAALSHAREAVSRGVRADAVIEELARAMGVPAVLGEDPAYLDLRRVLMAMSAAREARRFGEELRSGDCSAAEERAIALLLGEVDP